MKVVNKKIKEIKPYENNPRVNEEAVEYVKQSIQEFGFQNPIIIDKENVIIAGHTRRLAAMELGLKEVPCIVAENLTDEQAKAFRLADNKTAEFAQWDYEKLDFELADIDIDMDVFGFVEQGFEFREEDYAEITGDTVPAPHEVTLTCPRCGHKDIVDNFKRETN